VAPQSKKPGAHIGEQAVRTIDGVPTAITAFVGRTQRGPVDEPIIVTSFVEFESIFGGLWAHGVTAHSVGDFFDAGGSTAVIVRVHQPAAGDTASIARRSVPWWRRLVRIPRIGS
jgi:phage tail sheath protein FI